MKKQPQNIPKSPGVYFFSAKKKIIYIGKAQNLKSRATSYFIGHDPDLRKQGMTAEADLLTWHQTESDVEALILEAELIKKYRPKYNVLMRDDKQYLYVGFTREGFSKIFFTHQPTKSKNANIKSQRYTNYVGPFTEAWAVRYILKTLRRAFPYCTCKEAHKRRCQMAEIGRCLGICCLNKSKFGATEYANIKKVYQKNIRYIKNILSGKHKHVIKILTGEMKKSSAEQSYEAAGQIRNQLQALENIFKHRFIIKRDEVIYKNKGLEYLKNLLGLAKPPKRIEAYDISNIHGKFAVGSMIVFAEGRPDKNEYRKFRIRMPNRPNDTAMIREVLMRRLNHPEWPFPDVMLIDGGKPQLNAALSTMQPRTLHSKSIKIIALAKREEELYLPAEAGLPNGKIIKLKEGPPPLLHLLQHLRNEAHRFAITYHQLRRSRFLKVEP